MADSTLEAFGLFLGVDHHGLLVRKDRHDAEIDGEKGEGDIQGRTGAEPALQSGRTDDTEEGEQKNTQPNWVMPRRIGNGAYPSMVKKPQL